MGKGKFILGTIIGAAAGVLLAPMTGSEARKALKKKFNECKIKIQDTDFQEIREEFELRVDEIQLELEDLDKEKVIKIAKEKAKILKAKSEDLVAYAIKNGTPVIEDMAKEIKKHTNKVLDEVIKKLETKEEKAK